MIRLTRRTRTLTPCRTRQVRTRKLRIVCVRLLVLVFVARICCLCCLTTIRAALRICLMCTYSTYVNTSWRPRLLCRTWQRTRRTWRGRRRPILLTLTSWRWCGLMSRRSRLSRRDANGTMIFSSTRSGVKSMRTLMTNLYTPTPNRDTETP